MNPRLLVLGAGGMLSTALVQELATRRCETIALSETDCDITNYSNCVEAIRGVQPRTVINCAAYTDVDGAESRRELAHAVNAIGSRHVAEAAGASEVRCVYISTDYVFDGRKDEPYIESDPTNPVNAYGESKAVGEKECAANAPEHAIIRSSWLYGPHGRNFVLTVLRLAAEGKPLRVVADQVGSPTYTRDFARAIADIALGSETGFFHVTNSGSCSWYELAQAVLENTGSTTEVVPITSAEYKAAARRPINSRMASTRPGAFAALPHWKDALLRFLDEIGAQKRHST
jgi:dTDP-4-dehydrorhamnose reductase